MDSKKHILVVDDEEDIAFMVKSRLEANGYDVDVAFSGEECLEKMKKEIDPDLVVLDVILPQLSGYEVCARIKTDKSHDFPVVMLTSRDKSVDEKLGFLCKADAYIRKPLSGELLMPTIKELLRKKEIEKTEKKVRE